MFSRASVQATKITTQHGHSLGAVSVKVGDDETVLSRNEALAFLENFVRAMREADRISQTELGKKREL